MHQSKIVILNGETLYTRIGYGAIFIWCKTVRVAPFVVASQVPDHKPAYPALSVKTTSRGSRFRHHFRLFSALVPKLSVKSSK
jgi:hypothetical protein